MHVLRRHSIKRIRIVRSPTAWNIVIVHKTLSGLRLECLLRGRQQQDQGWSDWPPPSSGSESELGSDIDSDSDSGSGSVTLWKSEALTATAMTSLCGMREEISMRLSRERCPSPL